MKTLIDVQCFHVIKRKKTMNREDDISKDELMRLIAKRVICATRLYWEPQDITAALIAKLVKHPN